MSEKITIVLADDHPIVRQGFVHLIQQDAQFQVLGLAGNGREALAMIRELQPKVAVLDIAMPEMSGLDVAKSVLGETPSVAVVLLTMYRDREYFDEAVSLGIRGYILKDSAVADLLACLRTVAQGGHYISPVLSGYLLRTEGSKPPAPLQVLLDRLTPSEKAVMKLISQNKTSKEIADEMFISHRTVQNHRFNMCRKLELKGYNKLLHFALEHKTYLG